MNQMSSSMHLKHFVSSLKICAPHPGAVSHCDWPTAQCPVSSGALGLSVPGGFLSSWPWSKADRRVSGEAETKGVEIPNLLTLWTL